MRTVLSLTVAVMFATTAVAQTTHRFADPHELSESIAAKGNELCAKIADNTKKRRCEDVFSRTALEASFAELHALVAKESADREILNKFTSVQILFEQAIDTYSR